MSGFVFIDRPPEAVPSQADADAVKLERDRRNKGLGSNLADIPLSELASKYGRKPDTDAILKKHLKNIEADAARKASIKKKKKKK